jgi:hypothetical protein
MNLQGHVHTEDTRAKMRSAKANIVWVHKDNTKPKQINANELEKYLSESWVRGRGPKANW